MKEAEMLLYPNFTIDIVVVDDFRHCVNEFNF